MPWADDGDASAKKPGLEPISFDDLEELEQLLSGDEPLPQPAAPPTAPAAPPPPPPAAPSNEGAVVGSDPDPGPEAPEEGSRSRTIWRLKSASGLTYSFYDTVALARWAGGLQKPEALLVSIDGITWKAYGKFKAQIGNGGDAVEAFRGLASAAPPQAPAAAAKKASITGQAKREASAPAAAARRSTSNLRKASVTKSRTKTQTSELRRAPSALSLAAEAAAAAEDKRTSGGGPRKRSSSRSGITRTTASFNVRQEGGGNPWPGRLAFMGLGLMIGGASVYFGMYLLGFYDLSFNF